MKNLIDKYVSNPLEFVKKTDEVAGRLGIPRDWLFRVMWLESAFNHKAVNSIGATGLIQFTKSTAHDLGTSTNQLLEMTNIEQLDWVERYFEKTISWAGKPQTFIDTYLLVFYPSFVNKSDTASLPDYAYNANKGMDMDKDGKISKSDVRKWVNNKLAKAGISVVAGGAVVGLIAVAAFF